MLLETLFPGPSSVPLLMEAPSGVFYHVTFRKHMASIADIGLVTGRRRVWNNAFGAKLGERGAIYLFSSLDAAVRWAAKMDFDFRKGDKRPGIVILKIENPPGKIVPDDAMGLHASRGSTWMTATPIPPSCITKTIPLTDNLIRSVVQGDPIEEDTDDVAWAPPADDNPRDWLLHGRDGFFVIYNRNFLNNRDVFMPIKGFMEIKSFSDGSAMLKRFHAVTPNLKKMMLTLAANYAASKRCELRVPKGLAQMMDRTKLNFQSEHNYIICVPKKDQRVDVDRMTAPDRAFLAQNDKDGSFQRALLMKANGVVESEMSLPEPEFSVS